MKTLYDYQHTASAIMDHNFLLADDCGLGKSLMAIEAAKQHGQGRPILILTRKASKYFWRDEFIDQGYNPLCVHVSEDAGRGLPLPLIPTEHDTVYITHHEALLYIGDLLSEEQWGLVVVDEAHRFRYKSKRTRALKKLRSDLKFCLTATPYGKDPSDMWAMLNWLYPHIFHSYWRFYERYVDYFTIPGTFYRTVRGGQRLDELSSRLAPFHLARRKQDVLAELPSFTSSEVPVKLATKQSNIYDTLMKDQYLYLEEQKQEIVMENALVMMLRLHQVSLDPALCVPGWKERPAKVNWMVEWLEDNKDQPVILAVRYRKFVNRWLDALHWPTIVGGMKDKAIQESLCRFNDTGRMVGTIQAISEGLNLQRANNIIIPDGTSSPTDLYQLTQRVHRIGQSNPCTIYHLLGERRSGRSTVDRLLYRKAKRRLSEQAMLNEFIREVQNG